MLLDFAVKSHIAELDANAEHSKITAVFLAVIRERRRPGEVTQAVKALSKSKAFEAALAMHQLLHDTPSRPGAWQPVAACRGLSHRFCGDTAPAGLLAQDTDANVELGSNARKVAAQSGKKQIRRWIPGRGWKMVDEEAASVLEPRDRPAECRRLAMQCDFFRGERSKVSSAHSSL